MNVSANAVDLDSEDEKEELKKTNEESKEIFACMKEAIGEGQVKEIRFTHRLKNHPVCLTSDGILSVEMEKVLNSMPNNQEVKANVVLEINEKHPIATKIKALYKENPEELKKYAKILYSQARLIEGLSIDNPTELSNLMCEIMTK